MRTAGLLFAIGLLAAHGACAQQEAGGVNQTSADHTPLDHTPLDQASVDQARARNALFAAVYASRPTVAQQTNLSSTATAALAPQLAQTPPGVDRLALGDTPVPGEGLAHWSSRTLVMPANVNGAVDTMRVSLAQVDYAPGGVITGAPGRLGVDTAAYDVSYVRHWPGALKLTAGRYDLAFSPHAGFGVNSAGEEAEAGATVSLGAHMQDQVMRGLDRLGLHTMDSHALENRGRWYLFGAVSGKAIGFNMGSNAQGGMQRLGWSADGTSALISDAQAGLAWRRGDTEASVGYVHRNITADYITPIGPAHVGGSMVAFSFTIHPH